MIHCSRKVLIISGDQTRVALTNVYRKGIYRTLSISHGHSHVTGSLLAQSILTLRGSVIECGRYVHILMFTGVLPMFCTVNFGVNLSPKVTLSILLTRCQQSEHRRQTCTIGSQATSCKRQQNLKGASN